MNVLAQSIIPRPVKYTVQEGFYTITPTSVVVTSDPQSMELAGYLAGFLTPAVGTPLTVSQKPHAANAIRLSVKHLPHLPAESYRLNVTRAGIEIVGTDRGGLFNGIQTLLQLLPPQVYKKQKPVRPLLVSCVSVEDYPRFRYRGMMLDVARAFMEPKDVKRYIDWLSYHKINRLHWHLTDDEGWRIEIKSYPDLAHKAGYRGGDSPVKAIYGEWDQKYGGYYTQDQIRDIVRYARFRNIEIIPEVEFPGHSRAVARVYPEILCSGKVDSTAAGYDRRNVWCVSKESNYVMLKAILKEVAALFPYTYIHVGGDEVESPQWRACPDCSKLMKGKKPSADQIADHFTERIENILHDCDRKMAVWNESIRSGELTPHKKLIYGWEHVKACKEATDKGYRTVVMPGTYFYFDMKQSPSEPGMTWAGVGDLYKNYMFRFSNEGFTGQQMENVEGVEGALFGELVLSSPDYYREYQSYPRICSLSEIAWTPEEARDWDDFYGRLVKSHFDRLSAMGIRFRLFAPGVDYSRGTTLVTPPFAGTPIRYTTDGSEPNPGSMAYRHPVRDRNTENYLYRAFYGTGLSPALSPALRRTIRIDSLSSRTVEIELADVLDRNGIWYLNFLSPRDNVSVASLQLSAPDTSFYLVRSGWNILSTHQMRLPVTDKVRAGKLILTLKNGNPFPCDVAFTCAPSGLIEPKVTMTSSVAAHARFPFSNATDYNVTSYARTQTTCRKGDTFTFTFDQPVDCHSIEVGTGLHYLPRFHIPFGYVELSADGRTFIRAGSLSGGYATVYPTEPVKVLRIVSESDGNGEESVAIQDLRIKPLKP